MVSSTLLYLPKLYTVLKAVTVFRSSWQCKAAGVQWKFLEFVSEDLGLSLLCHVDLPHLFLHL